MRTVPTRVSDIDLEDGKDDLCVLHILRIDAAPYTIYIYCAPKYERPITLVKTTTYDEGPAVGRMNDSRAARVLGHIYLSRGNNHFGIGTGVRHQKRSLPEALSNAIATTIVSGGVGVWW